MLVVRDLCAGPKRTTELLSALHPISSRTLVGRLRDMEKDGLIVRRNLRGIPPHVEYELTERGGRLIPLLHTLMRVGQALECNECEDRKQRLGNYCDSCPILRGDATLIEELAPVLNRIPTPNRRPKDDSIVLL
jgi:DNA-binding HxlR family transcriptional regulator